ncbi:MAG: sugar phosphate isomerase/epimerase [Chloroflexales bacterium]|nr:sugar phosphate isomerase/epimerase [Chloroflexales bacterium]
MRREQIAINSVSTRQRDLVEALDAYAAAGFRSVEFVLPLIKGWLAAGHTVADVRGLLEERGLRSIGGFEAPVVCFGEGTAQAANHALQRANAQLIHDLGGGTLVVGTDGPPQPNVAALDEAAQTLAQLARQIEGLDVTIAVEFNWSPLVRSLSSAVRVAQAANHPQVGVLFDPAHYYVTPTKREDLTPEAVRWVRHVHLNDMRDKPPDLSHCNDDRVLPGSGVLDLAGLIALLEAGGYSGYFAIEMFNADLWALPAATAAERCYASMLAACAD